MRARGVRAYPVPQPTDALWQAATAPAVIAHRLRAGHRATVLRTTRRQDAHRDSHQRHAAQWRLFQLALHAHAVVESASPIEHWVWRARNLSD